MNHDFSLDFSELDGGLGRMLDRLRTEGTATKDAEADAFLTDNANACLLGLLFDQRVLAEVAFIGPLKLHQRLGHLDLRKIADMDAEAFIEVFKQSPAVHRFTAMMAGRTQEVARMVADEYKGDAANIWHDTADYATVEKRISALPGFGKLKAKKMRYVLHYFLGVSF